MDNLNETEFDNIELCTDIGFIPQKTLKDQKSIQEFIFKNGIKFIEKQAGQLVISEKITEIDLCQGFKINVRLVELPQWKKTIEKIEKLPEKLKEEFKSALVNIEKTGLTVKKIDSIIDSIKDSLKTPKYRQSGHLVDQKLKYSTPNQRSLFDYIQDETKKKIEESKIEVKAEGIKLTPPENKIVHALNRILCEKSQTKNSKAEDFYGGNAPSHLVPYGINQEQKAVVLKFKPSELYKAYMGKDEYSGADIDFINNTLYQLESKKVLIKYDRIKKTKTGKKEETLTDRIEDFQSLIKIIVFIPDLTNEEKERLDSGDYSIRESKGEMIIGLNPIFTDQIDAKFIEFPMDTNRRLVIAAGGHNKVTSSMHSLMEWMLRDISAKRYKSEINEDGLPYMLGLENYVKQNRKKKLKERIEKDVKAMINLGILIGIEKKPNSTGGEKWIFHLNKDYE